MLADEDFWMLLTGAPTEPNPGYGGNPVSPRWVDWAKRMILDVSFVPTTSQPGDPSNQQRGSALALYLCRLVRILDSMESHLSPLPRQADVLENLLLGAADLSSLKIDLRRGEGWGASGDRPLRQALNAGMIQSEQADLWRPGMASGSGATTVYRLTVLGKRKADAMGPPPPYLWSEQDEVDDQAAPAQEPAAPPAQPQSRQQVSPSAGPTPVAPPQTVAAPASGPIPEDRCHPMKKNEIAARILNRPNVKDARPREVEQKLESCKLRNEGNGRYSIVLDPGVLSKGEIDRLKMVDWPPPPRVR